MNIKEVMDAWKEAQDYEGRGKDWPDFHGKFYQLTGITAEEVKRLFNAWNVTRHERAIAIAEKHGVDIRSGFQAFLVERFWPDDPEMKALQRAEKYLRLEGQPEGAEQLAIALDVKVRLGRFPINFCLTGQPTPAGDPREGRGDWPPEEDCPHCPTGRKDDLDSPHKMSCTWAKGESGRMTVPAHMDSDGQVHVDLLK